MHPGMSRTAFACSVRPSGQVGHLGSVFSERACPTAMREFSTDPGGSRPGLDFATRRLGDEDVSTLLRPVACRTMTIRSTDSAGSWAVVRRYGSRADDEAILAGRIGERNDPMDPGIDYQSKASRDMLSRWSILEHRVWDSTSVPRRTLGGASPGGLTRLGCDPITSGSVDFDRRDPSHSPNPI